MPTPTVTAGIDRGLRWLLPSGNLGDALLLSGLLRARHTRTGERFGLVRVRPYSALFRGHPAIAQIASADALQLPLQRTDYFTLPCPGKHAHLRPWARLSRLLFGEVLEEVGPWAPLTEADTAALAGLPFTVAPILIAPGSDSPRMEWDLAAWAAVIAALAARTGLPIAQVGMARQVRLPGALDLTGKLTPRELVALAGRAQVVIGCDPFLTQAAAAMATPALTIFGPTSAALHAALGQHAVEHTAGCATPCLDQNRDARGERCPERRFCMAEIEPARVLTALEPLIAGLVASRPLFAPASALPPPSMAP